jgi:hypothetical protein
MRMGDVSPWPIYATKPRSSSDTDYLNNIEIRNLRIGEVSVDLALSRHAQDVSVNVLSKDRDVSVSLFV